jgi:hypothetical protein
LTQTTVVRAPAVVTVLLVSAALAAAASRSSAAAPSAARLTCPSGSVHAKLSSGEVCLRSGGVCKTNNHEYRQYGFACRSGHLVARQHRTGAHAHTSKPPPKPVVAGKTVLLGKRTRSTHCSLGPEPDSGCSPGAYYSNFNKKVVCSASFRTATNVPELEKFAVEREYGLPPRDYGSALEIDHIVSLELGGSNNIANLFPERLYANPGYRVKDKLESRLRQLVCAGKIKLRKAQHSIASDWESLYKQVFGHAPATDRALH